MFKIKTILNPDPKKSEKLYLDPKLTVMPHIGSSTRHKVLQCHADVARDITFPPLYVAA
jgi:hypothetical protein